MIALAVPLALAAAPLHSAAPLLALRGGGRGVQKPSNKAGTSSVVGGVLLHLACGAAMATAEDTRLALLAQMAVGLLSSAATEVTALGAARAQEEGDAFGTAAAVRDRLCGRAQGEARLRQLRLTAPIYSETPEAAVGTCVKGEQVTELVT